MTRWHHPSCKTPQIAVDGTVPRCLACDSTPPLQDLILKGISLSPLSPIPPDESPGRLGLWWPPCVPYSKPELGRSPDGDDGHRDETAPPTALEANRHIYGDTLGESEFRLACLSPAADPRSPIHATLEVYPHDGCPEYETVSYTWGGESSDSTLCCPLYVGPYWDVMLQTKNCDAMLRHMRPHRGVRIAWVDALCINQNDTVERGHQVAKMGQIYEEATRAFVYLGEDVVCPKPAFPKHPARQPLHDFVRGSISPLLPPAEPLAEPRRADLQSVLSRRYFTRVWVIQELVLSHRVMIPVGDVEFTADTLWPKHLESAPGSPQLTWEATAAPWFQHVAQRRVQETGMQQMLMLTSKCGSADPRDRVFGLLGLLDGREAMSLARPDYSLSCQHVFIGLFSHVLLNLRNTRLLNQAAGLFSPPRYPSWLPRQILPAILNQGLDLPGKPSNQNPWARLTEEAQVWHHGATIDAETGILSINAVRLLALDSSPPLVTSFGCSKVFHLKSRDKVGLFLCLDRWDSDELPLVSPSDQLYFLKADEGPSQLPFTYLILRAPPTDPSHPSRLVASSDGVFVSDIEDWSEYCRPTWRTWTGLTASEYTAGGNYVGEVLVFPITDRALADWKGLGDSLEPYIRLCVSADLRQWLPCADPDKKYCPWVPYKTWSDIRWLHDYLVDKMDLKSYSLLDQEPSGVDGPPCSSQTWNFREAGDRRRMKLWAMNRWRELLKHLDMLHGLRFGSSVGESWILENGLSYLCRLKSADVERDEAWPPNWKSGWKEQFVHIE